MAGQPAANPNPLAWTLNDTDDSGQFYIRISSAVPTRANILRTTPFVTDNVELRQQAIYSVGLLQLYKGLRHLISC